MGRNVRAFSLAESLFLLHYSSQDHHTARYVNSNSLDTL